MRGHQSQRGVALVIVLMIVALVSILATEMSGRLQLSIQRASNIKDNNQAYLYALGAEQFATVAIKQLIDANNGIVNLEQPWSEPLQYPLPGGGIEAHLVDMQGCFNLNALSDTNHLRTPSGTTPGGATNSPQPNNANNAGATTGGTKGTASSTLAIRAAAFETMLRALQSANIDSYSAETLRDSLADWLDEDDTMRTYGAEDSEYAGRSPAYLAANQLMTTLSELRLVNGADMEWLPQVLPLLCVLPEDNRLKININTIDEDHAAVLAGVTGMSLSDATGIISSRKPKGWEKVDDFMQLPEITALNLSNDQKALLDVTTQYFMLRIKTRYNSATFNMSTLFRVDSNDQVTVVRREFGGVK
ncbi:type II secretion system minor pseudopilin GspK [Aestuariibacter halophilus]|uniref:Type II secretion system protein K n=1 Tax=Fluctibacter halophilus TaxID=226011 RepID=A0ABS8GAC4_9ALTE|nr:type II secretion system minor pseudopilin GspK [Aestuariibacter halophilus]MCC2617046.1 type II secretion system minor pseudopilin GspK [Aestuariibacter halophilus]